MSTHRLLALAVATAAGCGGEDDPAPSPSPAEQQARYAELAGLPADRRTPRVLRHTFCTHLPDAGTPIDVIRELAGQADIRTTTIYTDVADERLEDAIESAARRRQGLGRLAAQRPAAQHAASRCGRMVGA